MKRFLKVLFPGLAGIAIYLLIRLITDSQSLVNVWQERDWLTNVIELIVSFSIGYIIFYLLRRIRLKYDRKLAHDLQVSLLYKEVMELLLYTYIVLNLTATMMATFTDNGLQLADFVIINTVPVLVILLIHAIYRSKFYMKEYIANQTLLQEIENDKLDTELQFLKAQYHPHFLFNALNTVYFQMDESTIRAKETLEKLSDLLRYQLYEDQQTVVPLDKELAFISRYVALQKERQPESATITEQFEAVEGKIYPLLLMPLVENAFKYASGNKKEITFKAVIQDNRFCFEAINSIQNVEASEKEGGIGISNLQRRLELLYKNSYDLQRSSDEHYYYAKLMLPI